jgi:FHS family Na+ dependent glucose MFS transporter 1
MQGKIQSMTQSTLPAKGFLNKQTSLAITAGYYFAFLSLGAVSASLGPTLARLASQTGVRLNIISILFIMRSLGYLLGSAIGGKAVDRLPGNRLLTAMVFALGGMMALVPLIPSFVILCLVLLILGLAEGALDVSANALLVWLHHRNVAPYLNGLHFFFGLGALISPFVVGQVIIATNDIDWAYWILAMAILPAGLWLLPLPSPKPQTARSTAAAPKARMPLVLLAAGVLMFYVGAEGGYGGWVFNYASERVGVGTALAAAMTSVFWASLTVGRLISIPIAALIRPSHLLYFNYSVCFLSTGVLAAWPDSPTALWIGTIGLGFGMSSIFPTMVALAGRRMGASGETAGWLFVGGGLGGMTLPWLVGQFFESWGPGSLLFFVAAGLLVGVVLMTLTLWFSRNSEPKEV